MVGGAALALGCLIQTVNPSFGPQGNVVDPLGARMFLMMLALVAMPGLFFTQLGFHQLGAAGGGTVSRVILWIGGIGCLFVAVPSIVSAITLTNQATQLIGQLLAMMVAPILWGLAALRARKVAPWKQIWPTLTGLWPPLMFTVAVPAGLPPFAVPGFAGLYWLVFGYAVWSEARASV
jgi:cytochrome c oxidase assembly factor CtaG